MKPVQGIALLFLLLIIPVGIFLFQTQNTEIRSKAGYVEPTPEECANDPKWQAHLKCKNGEAPAFVVKQVWDENKGKNRTVKTCECKPKPTTSLVVSSPTPAKTLLSMSQRCNTSCQSDDTCGNGMVCALVGGVGKCRNAECYGLDTCQCYAVNSPTPTKAPVSCNATCATDMDCGSDKICITDSDGKKKCRNANCYAIADCDCYKINSPTPSPLPLSCNASCTTDSQCGTDMVCITDSDGNKKCRNASCFGVADCVCYRLNSPTPTPACNATCSSDTDCGSSMICVKTASGNKCRNPSCYGTVDCLCYELTNSPTSVPTNTPVPPTPTARIVYVPRNNEDDQGPTATPRRIVIPTEAIVLTPTPTTSANMNLAELLNMTPTPFLLANAIKEQVTPPTLTIEPFYNAKKQTNPLVTLIGMTEPEAQLSITISPDGIMSTVTADTLGNWQFAVPKKMSNGEKQLTITARTTKGGVTTKTEVFSVVGGFEFPLAAIAFTALIALGIAAYIVYQKMKSKNTPPPQTPYMPNTPGYTPPPTQSLPPYQQQASAYGFETGRKTPPIPVQPPPQQGVPPVVQQPVQQPSVQQPPTQTASFPIQQ